MSDDDVQHAQHGAERDPCILYGAADKRPYQEADEDGGLSPCDCSFHALDDLGPSYMTSEHQQDSDGNITHAFAKERNGRTMLLTNQQGSL